MKRKYLIQLVIFLAFCCKNSNVYAQYNKQYNNWYIDDSHLDFSFPQPVLTNGVALDRSFIGTVSMSDASGNFLFGLKKGYGAVSFPEGLITNVILMDRNLDSLSNGDIFGAILGLDRIIAVPRPLHDSLFYIFNLHHGTTNTVSEDDSLYYSLIDLRENNGLGAVTVKMQPIGLYGTANVQAVRHRNNKDFWVIVNDKASHMFDAYLVNENGISATPVRSGSGVEIGNANFRFSPDGKQLVAPVVKGFNINSYIGLYDFDNRTGVLSNEKLVKYSSVYGPSAGYLQAEFSPDSKLLYLVYELNTASANCAQVAQYNVSLPDTSEIRQSRYFLGNCYDRYFCIRLGPNGKMYLSNKPGAEYMSVIQAPNLAGVACGYTRAVYYPPNPGIFQSNLPNTISNTLFAKPALDYGDSCATDTMQFWASSTGCTQFHKWNFGDPASGAGNFSTSKYPRHLFSGPGTYTVQCITELDTLYKTVQVFGQPALAYATDTTICAGQPLTVAGKLAGTRWQWEASEDSVLVPQQSGTYWLVGSNPCGTGRQAVQVTVIPELVKPFQRTDTLGCGVPFVQLNAGNAGSSYLWSTGQTSQAIDAVTDGQYTVQISNACFLLSNSITVRLRQPAEGPTKLNVFTPNGDGLNDEISFFEGDAEEYKVEVYNRWGTLVWHSTNPTDNWNGEGAPAGLYYYSLRFTDCSGQQLQHRGTVSLLR